jgi:hypothetical protein
VAADGRSTSSLGARLRTHVEFRSDAFPSEPGEEEKINPGRWGIALARYIRTELTARGLPGGEPFFEDWGCCVPLDNEGFSLWAGCGNYEEYPDGFLCFIEPSKPSVRKLFRKIDTSGRVESVADALDAALRAHPSIRDLRWWTGAEAST